MKHIAVFISGGGSNLQTLIDATLKGEINGQIDLVVSNRMNAYGLVRAKDNGIETLVSKDQALILKKLLEKEIDFVVLAGYLAIVDEQILDVFKNRIINIHPSLIPSFCGMGYYGMHVHEAVYQRGVKVSGATVHFVSKDVDGGPIILQKAVDITTATSPQEIQQMVLDVEHQILKEAVKLYCDQRIEVNNKGVKVI